VSAALLHNVELGEGLDQLQFEERQQKLEEELIE
jgi:hypothetical protein